MTDALFDNNTLKVTKEKYNITDNFYRRYIKENSENRFGIELAKFMWFKEGKFLPPQQKKIYLEQFEQEEIENFYKKNEINIPFLEFNITTRCTLKCKDCCALIPQFNGQSHFDLKFVDFKEQLDKILSIANIRNLVLLGGEPLINPELPEIVDYAAKKSNISIIRITTNGTIMPSKKLLKVLENNHNRIYLYLSNYSANIELLPVLKYNELKHLLHEKNIKFQMVDSWNWLSEKGMSDKKDSRERTLKKVKECYRIKCTQVFDGIIDVCSKAHAANKLKLIQTNDYINIANSQDLKSNLISFYTKSYSQACEYCIISNETVKPALQKEK